MNIQITHPIIVIYGPTAVGKSSFALTMAHQLPGSVIISADAFQVYRGMDIGTAKLPLSEQEGIPHYLIDTKNFDERYSIGEFLHECSRIIEIQKQAQAPTIICGGTAFYIQAFLYEFEFKSSLADSNLRQKLIIECENFGLEQMWSRLCNMDPKYASAIHQNDQKRILRGLELFELTGAIPSLALNRSETIRNDVQLIGLFSQKDLMYERINARVESMIHHGLIDEVDTLRKNGFSKQFQSYSALGYSDVDVYLDGAMGRTEMIESIKLKTRRFSKRQMTWFRRFHYAQKIEITSDLT